MLEKNTSRKIRGEFCLDSCPSLTPTPKPWSFMEFVFNVCELACFDLWKCVKGEGCDGRDFTGHICFE